MGFKAGLAALFMLLARPGAAWASGRCVLAALGTCSQLAPSLYPADNVTWFNPAQQPQVVLYAQMLFPLQPGLDDKLSAAATAAWHPPLVYPGSDAALAGDDRHFVEAEWFAPDGGVVADLGTTLAARAPAEYLHLQGRTYIPHTFAPTIGTKDLRAAAGQKVLADRPGLYTVRLYVDGKMEGISFFSVLDSGPAKAVQSQAPQSGPAGAAR